MRLSNSSGILANRHSLLCGPPHARAFRVSGERPALRFARKSASLRDIVGGLHGHLAHHEHDRIHILVLVCLFLSVLSRGGFYARRVRVRARELQSDDQLLFACRHLGGSLPDSRVLRDGGRHVHEPGLPRALHRPFAEREDA